MTTTNPYLQRLREQYDTMRSSIEGLQQRAVEANRELTEPELTQVRQQGEQAAALLAQIESLTEIEQRNRRHAELGASLQDSIDRAAVDARRDPELPPRAGQPLTGTAQTRDRDPGHYTRSSPRSFFGDLHRARAGDEDAQRRLAEHQRALSTGVQGTGIVPPQWLVQEYEELARQGRAAANAVRNIPLGDDPRPITLPKQTAGTDDVVTEQAAENDSPLETDEYDSGVDTVVPKPTAGVQVVSRQMLDMSSPAVDLLIYGDLLGAYNDKVEAKVCAAIVAAAGVPVATLATEADFDADGAQDAVVDAAMAVWNRRKRPADLLLMSVLRWGKFKKLRDSTGRPLIPASTAGPVNVAGVGTVTAAGQIEELPVIVTDGIGNGATYPESVVALRAADAILFESNVMRFRYEEPLGPESVKLGIWGYTGVLVRQKIGAGPASKSVARFEITAAAATP